MEIPIYCKRIKEGGTLKSELPPLAWNPIYIEMRKILKDKQKIAERLTIEQLNRILTDDIM